MDKFKAKMNVLNKAQKRIWSKLEFTKGQNYVLYGGTACALQLGHRKSEDFDFFTDKQIDKKSLINEINKLSKGSIKTTQDKENTFSCSIYQDEIDIVNLSFFGGIDFGRVENPLETDDGVMYVASLSDIMAIKLATIVERIEVKDYQDIAAMIRAGKSIKEGLACAQKMYRNFSPMSSIRSVSYFGEGIEDKLSKEDRNLLVNEVKKIDNLHLPEIQLKDKELVRNRSNNFN